MANPNVLSVYPLNNGADIVLGTKITVTFDSLINTSTISSNTFSLTGPAQTQILTPTQLIAADPSYINGRAYIKGSFAFTTNVSNQTVVTFTPEHSLQPNTTYTVLLIGVGALLVSSAIRNTNGDPLSSNYTWSFSTGTLNTIQPPIQAPLPYQQAQINPDSIKVRVNGQNAGDLLNQDIAPSYEVDLVFPAPLDTTSFSTADILLSLEQFLGDPTIPVPTGLVPTVTVVGNIIKIIIEAS